MASKVLKEPVFTGRERELQELESLLNSAVNGKGKTVFVSGEAGSGKTRLVNEFLSEANKKGIVVLSGWCLSDTAVPYLPFAEAFRKHFGGDEETIEVPTAGTFQPSFKLGLAGVEGYGITGWLSGLGYPVEHGKAAVSPQVWKDQLFTAVAESLHVLSAKQPVLMLLEDVHWADSASLALVHYIARVINEAERILVVATFRSEELTSDAEGRPHPLLETLRIMRREELVAEIKLSSLSEACVAKMAESMMGSSLQQEFAAQLAAESRGNPLFILESLRMLHERKSLVQEKNEWRLSGDALWIPSKIKDIILRRLAALKHAQRRILDAASVIGEEFNVELLSTVLGQDSLDVIEALDLIAQSTSIIRAEKASYRFDHARSREVLYETLSLPLRRAYHSRIAEKLEIQSKSDRLPFADLAYHYAQAENEEKAVKYSLAAGKEALARWSNTEAAKHFQYVLQKISDSPERSSDKVTALEGLGDAYYANANFSQAVTVFGQLTDLQSGAEKLRALRKAMFAAFYLGDIPLLAELTRKAEENATADRLEAGRILHQKARILAIQNDIPSCLRISEEALKIFEEEYALSDAAWILFTIGSNSSTLGHNEKGVAAALRSIALYDDLGDILSQMEAYIYAGFAFGGSGLSQEVRRMYERVIELNEKFRLCDYIHLIPVYAYSSFTDILGGLRPSISRALKALEYAEKTDSSLYLGIIYEILTIAYAFAEDPVHMEEYYEKLMSLPDHVLSNVFSQGLLKVAMGVYHAAKDEFEKSNQYFNEIFQDATAKKMGSRLLRHMHAYSWVLRRQGRIDEAKSLLEKGEEILERAQEKFRHVNVQTSLMTNTHPGVDQTFEMRLDLVNVSENQGHVVKVEDLAIPELEIVDLSPNCRLNGGWVEFKDDTIKPFEVKTVKLAVKAANPEVFNLNPTVTYINELGETKTNSTRPFTMNIQPTPEETKPAGKIPTGLEPLDNLLLGGLPEGHAIALTSPSTDERGLLVKRFLETGASAEETIFYVTQEAGTNRALAEENPSKFFLFLCNPQADTMIQNAPNVFKLKGVENLTEIDIALTKAFRIIEPSAATGPKRACIEIVSDVLLQHHVVTTRRWLIALLPTLKSRGFTILAVVDPQMHPPEELQALVGVFDGEIRVTEKETPEGIKQMLRVRKLLNQKYMENEIVLTKEKLSG